jgi:hypothetical protein
MRIVVPLAADLYEPQHSDGSEKHHPLRSDHIHGDDERGDASCAGGLSLIPLSLATTFATSVSLSLAMFEGKSLKPLSVVVPVIKHQLDGDCYLRACAFNGFR